MENRQQQILSEIMEVMSSIRIQLEKLDAKMAELQYEVDPQPIAMEPIDLQLDDMPDFSDQKPVEEPVAQETDDDDLPFFDEPEEVCQEQVTTDKEPVLVELPVEEPDAEPVAEVESRQAVIDAMIQKQAWRTDMPGAPVRDIRSAISLNDRVLFINGLFDEDPVSFQETLSALNQMTSLDEAVAYLVQRRPSWNLESEIVYRFMMALRRKVN